MKLEDQVCTFEQAKRLNELGVDQAGIFSWVLVPYQDETEYRIKFRSRFNNKRFSAFTVSELLEMVGSVELEKEPNRWYVRSKELAPASKNIAWGLAETLIYRLENNLITSKEVNKRLTHA